MMGREHGLSFPASECAGKTIIFLRECCEDIKLKTHADEHDTGGTTSTLASTDVHTFTVSMQRICASPFTVTCLSLQMNCGLADDFS